VKLELQDVGRVPLNAPKIAGCSGNNPYIFVSCNETKTSKANNLKVTIGALKFFSRIIQQLNAIGNCPALAGLE
jgi:ribosomal protein L18E